MAELNKETHPIIKYAKGAQWMGIAQSKIDKNSKFGHYEERLKEVGRLGLKVLRASQSC